LNELKKRGIGLAAISYDPPEVLSDFARRRGITFPLLSDPESKTIKSYGILNTTVNPTASFGKTAVYGIPFPGSFIIDRKHVVTARRFEDAYQERATVSTILQEMAGSGAAAGAKHTTEHLEFTTYASDETIAGGTVFSLVLDIKPLKGIHVYAPGAKGYKTIALRLEPSQGLKLRPIQFPASEIYRFVPLNERVPVYRKPFRLVQELNVELSRDGQALLRSDKVTIRGFLDYQACNDKVCFVPMSVPVEWTVAVRKLDGERSTVSR
jgi:hypothetical protein